MSRCLWIDASAGVAGDMLAGALVAAGAPLEQLGMAVTSVLPGAVQLRTSQVTRGGLACVKFDVDVVEHNAPHRHLSDIVAMVRASDLAPDVASDVLDVFQRLAEAEASAHGIAIDAVHFHEVGAADSIADIVAVCAGLQALDIDEVFFSTIALGSGQVRTEHGTLPVPTPAASELTTGLRVTSGGDGELATPTGLALLIALGRQEPMPELRVLATGAGAGTKDFSDRSNAVRVIVGERDDVVAHVLLETNIDDMDPRLWPGVIRALMDAGANDAWLTPIVMKKGRPAHSLSVLGNASDVDVLSEIVFRETSSIGLRSIPVDKLALDRTFASVSVDGHAIAVKLAGRNGRIYNVSLEFEDVAKVAATLARPAREVLADAQRAAENAGLTPGAPFLAD